MENDSQKAGRHRNDTRKDTRLHCSDFSALKNPTTYSDTRSSPLLHLQDRSDHHVLLLVVELVHHIFCLLQELIQSVWQRMIKSGLNEMTLVWKVKNLKRPWGSHGAKNLQARGQGCQRASPSFEFFCVLCGTSHWSPVYLVIFCCWVGPVPYLELFWAGPVKKITLYLSLVLFRESKVCFHLIVENKVTRCRKGVSCAIAMDAGTGSEA